MREIQLVYGNPVSGMEDEFNEWYPGPALSPVFSGYFYEAIGEKVVKR